MTDASDELLAEPIRRSLWQLGWERLRPLQEAAIRTILLSQNDVVLAAITALPSGVASAQGIVTWGSWRAVSGSAAYSPGGTVPVGCRCRPRWTALSKTLTPRPRAMRSAIIWPVTTSRATSVLAVMSPNPTVANTVTVK